MYHYELLIHKKTTQTSTMLKKVILPQLVKPETCILLIRAVLAYAEGLSHNKPQIAVRG